MKDSTAITSIFDANDPAETSVNEFTPESCDEEEKEDGFVHEEELSAEDFFEFLSRAKGLMPDSDGDLDSGEENEEDNMDADDIHNKAVKYARLGKSREASEICMRGVKKYPLSVDLLADTINYSSEAGDLENAAKYYAILKEKVPFQRWNWRAFTFSFDYLLKSNPVNNEQECRSIVNNYKKYLPYEEKASMAESELEAAIGNAEKSMLVLKEAIRIHTNAPQCSLRLADMQMDRGMYEDVIATTNYGIAASAETQPSINIPYLFYVRALAKDYLLHRKECDESVCENEVRDLKKEYELLLSEFPELMQHAHNIKMRIKMLKFIKTT